ncbi:hypothetical protein PPTG_06787 [Phytophthora nicotianae INRA-310]|uniref:Vacuolar protein 8 n=1 Tax=Phytophthora nicotianae (strain INRA-310) TaxID=761204 RepID=W2QSP8_PHYN3|nr:hypothetical protein PPTG_06787 [Phytophthora nicotianae INRA-310]ETN15524.1 hypothetical protein PPTG_06787 [Phytophthora nicotianae INRA-310]
MRRLSAGVVDGREQLPTVVNGEEQKAKTVLSRPGSSSLDRGVSRGIPGRRKSRANTNRRVSSASMTAVVEEEKSPSTTAIRLRALALAVRARHSLGIQRPAERKYLLHASESGTEESGVDLLMEGIQTKLKDDVPSGFLTKNVNNNRTNPDQELESISADTSAPPALQPTRKPSMRPGLRSASTISKASFQRINSIRGDASSTIRPYEVKPRDVAVISSPIHNSDARLTCAYSLYKLSCQTGCELAIIEGGAIAQIADFSDADDSKLLRYSASVLVNLTTDLSVLEDFTSKDGVSALLELSWAPLVDVKVACITALCRLSQSRARAATLIRHQAITEIMAILTTPHTPLQQLAVTCIVNLIFHGHTFPDRVFMGDPHAVQSPLGLLNVLSQLSAASSTSQFAIETLFNLSLYRSSCLSALRAGGAEILYTLVSQLCKLVDGSTGGASSRFMFNMGVQAPGWTSDSDLGVCMKLLGLAADTLANFSAFIEYHSMVGSHGIKALSLMLSGALRDVGNLNTSVTIVERFRCTTVSCSRSLVNFSSNAELRRQNFTPDLISVATKLALMDHQRYVVAPDARILLRNAVRTLSNLSFEATCRSVIIAIPYVLTMLNAIIVLPVVITDEIDDEIPRTNAFKQGIPTAETKESSIPSLGGIMLQNLSDADPVWYLTSSYLTAFPWTAEMSEDVKEDALITLLNLAQEATCIIELLRTLDGKLLAAAAENMGHSRRLRYIYELVISNLLFDSYLQQAVYGDQAIRALVNGFNFFEPSVTNVDTKISPLHMPNTALNSEKEQYQTLNLAFGDDQERFLASIFHVANELMDSANIELVVSLVLPCLRTYMELTTSIPANASSTHPQRLQLQRQLPIVCYASASLFALTRAATQRRDSHKHFIHSEETEAMLIAVSALPSVSIDGSTKGSISQAFCAATLYHLCASSSANQRIIQGLINCCNSIEECQALLACSAAFAITSFTAEGCQQLAECEHLARAFNRLGRSSHVECQQYAAIAACNVSTVACVWSSVELKDFIVVALLRANSIQTKQIHAKTLSNLLSHEDSRAKIVEDGVLYALMKLSQVILSGSTAAEDRRGSTVLDTTVSSSMDEVFSIGLRALFNLSCDHQYHNKLLSNGIMAYLSAAVEFQQHTSFSGGRNEASGTSFLFKEEFKPQKQPQKQCVAGHLTVESRRLALTIICNLTSYEENHKELIRAQVTEIIYNYADADIESRVSAAMALRNLSCCQPWVEMLCERKILQLLIFCMECDHPEARQFAAEALANCSLVVDSLHLFGEMQVVRAVIALLEVTANGGETASSAISCEVTSSETVDECGHTSASTYMAALKCLHSISHDDALALLVMEERTILRLLPLLEYRALGSDVEACELTASLMHTLATKPQCAEALLRQRTVSLCSLLHRRHTTNTVIARECIQVLMLLSTHQPIQLQLSETQAVHVAVSICGGGNVSRNLRLRECGAVTIRNLTLCVTEHQMLFYDRQDQSASASNQVKDVQTDDDNAYDREMPVSLMLERHLLHGIKYFQEEIKSGQASDRILMEASAAIANLSTIKVFRVAMVRLGVISTLLDVLSRVKTKEQGTTRSRAKLRPNNSSYSLLGRICAATLHRLVVEEEATIDARSQLVPSLLSTLRQTDEDLQQVRYECEKISIFGSIDEGVTPSTQGIRRFSRRNSAFSQVNGEETTFVTAKCVRYTCREQKWMVYVLKTILSSQSMIPQLEKKQMRTLGLPKLCFQDLTPATTTGACIPAAINGSSSSRSTCSNPHSEADNGEEPDRQGYLLPVNMEKHVIRRINGSDEIVPSSIAATLPRAKSSSAGSTRPIVSGLNSGRSNSANPLQTPAIDQQGHAKKFNRQMQLLRRNNRREASSLPPV